MTPESTQSPRHSALSAKHADLDAQIDIELAKPNPDQLIIQSLKKRKLAVKDELA